MANWNQLGLDIDGEAADDGGYSAFLKYSVSLSSNGSIMAIGAPFNDGAATDAGHVRVYEWNSGTSAWDQKGADIDGLADEYSGHSVSLSSDGLTVAIGATEAGLFDTANGTGDPGHVRVYEWNGGTSAWDQKGADIDGEAGNDWSGYSVSLSSDGTIVAIGARYNDGAANGSGHVRVYEYSGSSWSQIGADIDGDPDSDQSGWSVSLSSDGSIVAIGAPFNDDAAENAGHVRVYAWSGSAWVQRGADIDGDASLSDYSGYSVSLSSDGSIVAIGAIYNDGGGTNSGHVRVYEWNGATSAWDQKGSDIDGEAVGDESGTSVSLSSDGSIVAIGARDNDGTGNDAGHVRVYEWNDGTSAWDQKGADIDGEAANDYSGWNVSLSSDGTTVAISAPFNDGTDTNAGHVRVYSFSVDSFVVAGSNSILNTGTVTTNGTLSRPILAVIQKIIADNPYVNGAAIVHVSPLPNVPKTRLAHVINDNAGIDAISDILSTRFDDTFYYTGDE